VENVEKMRRVLDCKRAAELLGKLLDVEKLKLM